MFEYLVENGYTLELFVDFCFFGICMNLVMGFIAFAATVFKVASLSDDDIKVYMEFGEFRRSFAYTYNSPFKRLMYGLLLFLPMHGAIINAIFMWYLLVMPGINGLIKGYIAHDSMSIIQIIRYHVIKIDDKGNRLD